MDGGRLIAASPLEEPIDDSKRTWNRAQSFVLGCSPTLFLDGWIDPYQVYVFMICSILDLKKTAQSVCIMGPGWPGQPMNADGFLIDQHDVHDSGLSLIDVFLKFQ